MPADVFVNAGFTGSRPNVALHDVVRPIGLFPSHFRACKYPIVGHRVALEKAAGKYMVGYTDLHGSLDCVADWRGSERLCLDLMDEPDRVHQMLAIANRNFLPLYDHFDELLKANGQPSVTWMAIPTWGKMHIPCCDFTSMISTKGFSEFYQPSLEIEIENMTHNIFHLDGKGMFRHLDRILSYPQINAIQWVQGVGDDLPIAQWLPVIRKIQAAGKGVIADLQLDELDQFIGAMKPDGLYLCIPAEEQDQPAILKRLEKW